MFHTKLSWHWPRKTENAQSNDVFCWEPTLTKNKTMCVQLYRYTGEYKFGFEVDARWIGHDHAGFELEIAFLFWIFTIQIYDHRHWNYEENRWARPEDHVNRGEY